jgi:CRISPR-associated protein Cas6
MPIIDLSFGLGGEALPADHGYSLFSAICRVVPSVHSDETLGIHPVSGRPIGNRLLSLTPSSRLTFRLPNERAGSLVTLAGKALVVDGHVVRVGMPNARALRPSPAVVSRLVTVAGFMEPYAFLEAVERQIREMSITGEARLLKRTSPRPLEGRRGAYPTSTFVRRTLNIQDQEVVGFALKVASLSPTDSIKLQEQGLGGRRRFGCGIFVPEWKSGG